MFFIAHKMHLYGAQYSLGQSWYCKQYIIAGSFYIRITILGEKESV